MREKPSFEEYLANCVGDLGFGEDVGKAERAHSLNLSSALQNVQRGEIFGGILGRLSDMKGRYASGRPELLFYRSDPSADMILVSKPFESSIHKIYRHNVVFNRNFPRPPRDGEITVRNMYRTLDDLIRTRVVCKYLDGPKFVCDDLEVYCKDKNIDYMIRDLSTDAGYYAWHFYFRVENDFNLLGDVRAEPLWVELQISTQLGEAITSLTHGLYEERRRGDWGGRDQAWKWDPTSQRFRSAYIGHGLHLLEGMIQTFRDEVLQLGAESTSVTSGSVSRDKPPEETSTDGN